jgi:hypothetical protein
MSKLEGQTAITRKQRDKKTTEEMECALEPVCLRTSLRSGNFEKGR